MAFKVPMTQLSVVGVASAEQALTFSLALNLAFFEGSGCRGRQADDLQGCQSNQKEGLRMTGYA